MQFSSLPASLNCADKDAVVGAGEVRLLAIGGCPSPEGQSLGVAVIGCGNFARRQHLPNLMAMANAKLEVICDLSGEALRRIRDIVGPVRATQDAEVIWSDRTVGAVVIAVPAEAQGDLAEAALLAGKHLYVEKPGATLPQQFERLDAVRLRSRLLLAFGFNKRWAPA